MVEQSKILSREEIINVKDLPREEVPVKEWGGSVIVQGLTMAERSDYEEKAFPGKPDRDSFIARLVAMSLVDEQGNKLFTETDIEALQKKNNRPIMRLYRIAQKLSGLTKSDEDELVKNSKPGQPG